MNVEDSTIKWLVELSSSEEEADGIIAEFRPNFSYREKCALLLSQFPNISILGGYDGKDSNIEKTDYQAVLSAAVHLKWR